MQLYIAKINKESLRIPLKCNFSEHLASQSSTSSSGTCLTTDAMCPSYSCCSNCDRKLCSVHEYEISTLILHLQVKVGRVLLLSAFSNWRFLEGGALKERRKTTRRTSFPIRSFKNSIKLIIQVYHFLNENVKNVKLCTAKNKISNRSTYCISFECAIPERVNWLYKIRQQNHLIQNPIISHTFVRDLLLLHGPSTKKKLFPKKYDWTWLQYMLLGADLICKTPVLSFLWCITYNPDYLPVLFVPRVLW